MVAVYPEMYHIPNHCDSQNPDTWRNCGGWCVRKKTTRYFIVAAFALTLFPRPPFDLLADTKKEHVCLDPKKNRTGKSTLYPPHLPTIVDTETGMLCLAARGAKIHQAICRLAVTL